MAEQYRVNVYEDEYRDEVISRVRYNQNLDYWDGRNWSNGGVGLHKGITKLKDGRYVIIYGSDWQGSKDYGLIVSAKTALQEILKSGHNELLKTKKFKELAKLEQEILTDELIEEE